MPNNTTARVIRPVLRAAGLEAKVESVSTGRNFTYVRLLWSEIDPEKRTANAQAVIAALRPLWSDGEQRVTELIPGYGYTVIIRRAGWYRTEPQINQEDQCLDAIPSPS